MVPAVTREAELASAESGCPKGKGLAVPVRGRPIPCLLLWLCVCEWMDGCELVVREARRATIQDVRRRRAK